jgi:hypothetical protein
MKEKILEILRETINTYQMCNDDDPIQITGIHDATDQIVAYVEQHYYPKVFVEWTNQYSDEDGLITNCTMTIKESYQYWLTQIKK